MAVAVQNEELAIHRERTNRSRPISNPRRTSLWDESDEGWERKVCTTIEHLRRVGIVTPMRSVCASDWRLPRWAPWLCCRCSFPLEATLEKHQTPLTQQPVSTTTRSPSPPCPFFPRNLLFIETISMSQMSVAGGLMIEKAPGFPTAVWL